MKKSKLYGKLCLDLVLLILLSLEYQKQAIGMQYHELAGLFLCGLFLIHKVLNWQWIRGVTVSIVKGKSKINVRWIVDILLFVSMTAVLVTGLLISKTLPTSISNGFRVKAWHYFFAAASLALSGIHLGLHATLLKNNIWKKAPLPNTVRKAVGVTALCALLCFGFYNFAASGFISQFTRPFASTGGFPDRNFTELEGMDRDGVSENNMDFGDRQAPGSSDGEGMENGKSNGERTGKGRPDQGTHGLSAANAFSTFATYSSILCGFAIVTAIFTRLVTGKRRKGSSRTV